MVSDTEKAALQQKRRDILLSNKAYYPTIKEALNFHAKSLGTSSSAILNSLIQGGAANFSQHKNGRHIGKALHLRYRGIVCQEQDEFDAADAKYGSYLAERAARSEIDFIRRPEALLEMLFPDMDLSLAANDPAVAAKLFASIDELRQRSVDELIPLRAVIAATSFMGSVTGFRNIRERQLLSLYGGHIALRIVRDPKEYSYWVKWGKEHGGDLREVPASLEVHNRLDDVRLAAMEQVSSIEAWPGKEFWGKSEIAEEVRQIRRLAQAADSKTDIYRELTGGGVAITTLDYVLADIESLNPERRAEALSLWHAALDADLEAFETKEWAQVDLERIADFHLERGQLELAEQALRHHLQLEDASDIKSPHRKSKRNQRFADFYRSMAHRSTGNKREEYLDLALKYQNRG